jgi:hypothetical protein
MLETHHHTADTVDGYLTLTKDSFNISYHLNVAGKPLKKTLYGKWTWNDSAIVLQSGAVEKRGTIGRWWTDDGQSGDYVVVDGQMFSRFKKD